MPWPELAGSYPASKTGADSPISRERVTDAVDQTIRSVWKGVSSGKPGAVRTASENSSQGQGVLATPCEALPPAVVSASR